MNDEANFDPHAPDVFGPQGEQVVALLERARRLTPDEASALDAAEDDALDDGLDAAWDAVAALFVRDLISTEDYDTLTRAWRTTIGPIHPDAPELATITREDR